MSSGRHAHEHEDDADEVADKERAWRSDVYRYLNQPVEVERLYLTEAAWALGKVLRGQIRAFYDPNSRVIRGPHVVPEVADLVRVKMAAYKISERLGWATWPDPLVVKTSAAQMLEILEIGYARTHAWFFSDPQVDGFVGWGGTASPVSREEMWKRLHWVDVGGSIPGVELKTFMGQEPGSGEPGSEDDDDADDGLDEDDEEDGSDGPWFEP